MFVSVMKCSLSMMERRFVPCASDGRGLCVSVSRTDHIYAH
jgi:hypothetical protein